MGYNNLFDSIDYSLIADLPEIVNYLLEFCNTMRQRTDQKEVSFFVFLAKSCLLPGPSPMELDSFSLSYLKKSCTSP